MSQLTYLQAIVIGLLQGVSEMFPVSSLGHCIILPALIGGQWARTLNMTVAKSPYLSFVVAVHVATALAMLVFYRKDWIRIIAGLFSSIWNRRITTYAERLGWLLVAATIPVGLVGLIFQNVIRTTLGRPKVAAVFLTLNGLLLYGVEKLRSRSTTGAHATANVMTTSHQTDNQLASPGVHSTMTTANAVHRNIEDDEAADDRLSHRGWGESIAIGSAQILALLPGFSRSGATIAAGLLRGLDHEDAARFAFLLATPVILAAGLLELPQLAGPEGHGILGQVLVGSLVAGVGAYLSLRFLIRFFHTHTLTPFAIYCTVAGLLSLAWLTFA